MCFLSFLGVSRFVAGAVFGEVAMIATSFLVAGAIFADVGMSFFVAGTIFGDVGGRLLLLR